MESETPTPIDRKKTKKKNEVDYEREIPVGDCILTELNSEGDLVGFKVRPEIAKIMMYREDG